MSLPYLKYVLELLQEDVVVSMQEMSSLAGADKEEFKDVEGLEASKQAGRRWQVADVGRRVRAKKFSSIKALLGGGAIQTQLDQPSRGLSSYM
jgi:hypothetical protein